VACLKRWGLLERVLATNCPVIRTIGLDLGEVQLTGELPPFDGVGEICAPRRTVLDKLLLDAAAEAGAEVREAFTVTGLIWSADRVIGVRGPPRGGAEIGEQARIVIGADWRNSLVAKAVGAAEYNARPVLTCACYAYWRDVTPHVPAIHSRARRVVISFPTNDGLTVTPAVFPRDELPAVRASLEGHLSGALGLVGDFAEPFRRSARVERIRAMGDLPNSFVNPMGVAGHSSGTPAITRIRSWLRAFLTRSARQNGWRMRSMPDFPARDRSTRRWPNISAFATSTSRRCTI
jgi:hypothetical protein